MIFGRGPRAVRQRDRVVQLLESYKAVNPQMIQLDSLNPYSDLTRGDELVKRVPELEILHGGGVVIEYGEGEDAQHVVVRNQDLFQPIPLDPARGGRTSFASAFTGEDEITSALIRLREGKKSKVAFTTGHGEPSTSDLNPRGRGIGNWKARLTKVGCEVIDLNLIQDEIPHDLAPADRGGPQEPVQARRAGQAQGVRGSRAGRSCCLLGNTEPSGLDEFLKSFNLAIGSGLVIDPRFNFNRNPALVFAPTAVGREAPDRRSAGDESGRALAGAAPIHVFGQSTRGRPPTEPVDPDLGPGADPADVQLFLGRERSQEPAARLDPKQRRARPGDRSAWRSPSAPEQARPGDAAEGKPRLVLFSCPAMAENVFQEIEQTNLDLLMNAASWLRNRPDTQGIAPHTHVALTLSVDPFLRSRLILVPSVVAVMLIIAMGITVYIARRRMMKTYRTTYILLGLFFASLLVLWGLEYAGVRTDKERRLRETRILPDLIDVPEAERPQAGDRTGQGAPGLRAPRHRASAAGRWSSRMDVAAEPTRLETLVRNLKELRKSLDSGSIAGPADAFGLAPPVATVRLWGEPDRRARARPTEPIATLALGKTVRGMRYVRPGGTDAIEVADAKLLSAVDLPVADWREQVVMGVPTFQVASVTIKRAGQVDPRRARPRGRWRLTAPVDAPANPAKIESLLAALSSLRVVDGEKGFVADNVKDFAPFGLAPPAADRRADDDRSVGTSRWSCTSASRFPTIRIAFTSARATRTTWSSSTPRPLAEVPQTAVALRSQQVADIEPAAVTRDRDPGTQRHSFALKKGSKTGS